MGSFEEENLCQMVTDFLESESIPISPLLPSASQNDHDHTKHCILQEILASGNVAETEVLGSVMKNMRKKIDSERNRDELKKWFVKKLRIDGHNASLCHTTWPTTFTCPGGDYEYLEILSEDKNGCEVRVIVDTDFNSQFELARPTSTYRELFEMVPSIFVGTEQKLKKIISILCGEAKNSFLERGLYIPPWRTSTYMLAKWFSSSRKAV